jgi:putative Holliday junction resolvase
MMRGRILAVDLGEKRIGLAISDPTHTIASPLTVIQHTSRNFDAAQISQLCVENDVYLIVIGIPGTLDGEDSPQLRHAQKFMDALKDQVKIPIVTWDESYSTNNAQEIRRAMQVPVKKRQGHLDDLAAAVILQSYLESHPGE